MTPSSYTQIDTDALKKRMETPLALDSADCYALIAEVERLREIISAPELGIRKLLVENGTIQADLTAPPYVILLMVSTLLEMLKGAPNYMEAKIVADATDGHKYVLRVERYFGKTPHEARAEAEDQRNELAAAVRKVAWNERDGRCWCPSSPELHGDQHTEECLRLRKAMASLEVPF